MWFVSMPFTVELINRLTEENLYCKTLECLVSFAVLLAGVKRHTSHSITHGAIEINAEFIVAWWRLSVWSATQLLSLLEVRNAINSFI